MALFRFCPDLSQRLVADPAIEAVLNDCLLGVEGDGLALLPIRRLVGGRARVLGLTVRECTSVRLLLATPHGGLPCRRSEPVREETSARRDGENEWVVVVAGVGFEPTTSGL